MRKRLQPAWVVLAKATTDLVLFTLAMLGGFVFRFGPGVPEEFLSVGLQVLPLALAAKVLQDIGYGNVAHLEVGFNGWAEAGGTVEPVAPPSKYFPGAS